MSVAMESVVFTKAGFWKGASRAWPLITGLAPFGFVTGLITQHHGLTLVQCMTMNALVYAGASQLLALAGWSHPAPILAAGLAALAMNLRFALMGPVLSPWLTPLKPWQRLLSLALLVDHSWALAVTDMRRGGRDAALFLGLGIPLWLGWLLATTAGFLSASWLHLAPHNPVFFGALAAFIALLVPLWRGKPDILPWAVAGLVSFATAHLLPHSSLYIVAGALCGCVAGAISQSREA